MRSIQYTTPAGSKKLLSGVALNAAAGTRTITLDTRGRTNLTILVKFTRGGAATSLTMTGKISPDGGTTYFDFEDEAVSAGTGALVPKTWSRTTSVSENVTFHIPVLPHADFMQFVFGGAAANGSDLIDVYAICGYTP